MITKLFFQKARRSLFFALTYSIVMVSYSQQWEATDVTANDAFPIVDILSHNNILFATVNQVFLGTLEASTDDGQNWVAKSATNAVGFPNLMAVTDNGRLYLSTVNSFHNLLYYSTDNGDTFTEVDTTGLPAGAGGGVSPIVNLQAFGNMLVIGMGGAGYYIKDVTDPMATFTHFDTATSLNSGTDYLAFYDGTLYTYDNAGAKIFYTSTDFGATWSTASGNGLPSDLQSEILEVNPVNGRIYLSGESGFSGNLGSEYGLYYSDDEGDNWTKMDLSVVSSTNYLDDFHKVTSLFANGNLLYMAFDNDAADSTPDIISSNNFDTISLSTDTSGLPDVPGNVHGVEFLMHNGKMVLSLNILDVYVKNSVLSNETFTFNDVVSVYPTVVEHNLTVKAKALLSIEVFDNLGRSISSFKTKDLREEVDVSYLKTGAYFLKINNRDLSITKRIIKK